MRKLLYLFLAFLCVSCVVTKPVYVPVETNHTEYIHQTDSIYIHDSTFISTKEKGDTIYIDTYKYKYIYKTIQDTLIRVDSIPVIKEVEKTVEVNHLTWWQKSLAWIGGITCLLLVITFTYKLSKLF